MALENDRQIARGPAPHQRFAPMATAPAPGRGLYAGEPATCRRDPLRFAIVVAHLAVMLAVFQVYKLENPAFRRLVALTLGVLPVHYLLPYRWKKPFFIAASVAGLALVFGAGTMAVVVPLAAVLVGICFLRVGWTARAAAIGAIAAVLALARAGVVATGIPDPAWTVLGSLLMFRMLIYLYELKHARKPESLVDTLGYFFLLPNAAFIHFPVVDYRTLQRGYFASDVHRIQADGLRMIFRGTVHLLIYRLVYQVLLIKPDEVHSLATLAGFLVCNYLLYLHVSGQFHIACGMLHLFGYQLPETHHHYLLATSFTDYWRRINIYWKDFMVRLVFNPVVFRLKRWPQARALAAATAVVFVVTWALHAYQSFWLRGSWGFSVPDALFWGILGVLVLVNVQFDARKTRRRSGKAVEWTPCALALRTVQIAATFVTIALLWSLWSSPGLTAWLGMLRRGLGGS